MHCLTNIECEQAHTRANRVGPWLRVKLWRARRIEAKSIRYSRYLARKIDLDEQQREQVVQLLRELRKTKEIVREERSNGAANLFKAVGSDSFDALRVSLGIASSFDRLNLHLEGILQCFGELYSTLDESQRSYISRSLHRRVRYL